MKKELEDYLHLYLGCEFLDEKTKDELQYKLDIERLELINRTNDWKDIKLILRPLSDITEGEKMDLRSHFLEMDNPYNTGDTPWHFEQTRYLLSKHFDLFGLIEAGLAIDKSTLNP